MEIVKFKDGQYALRKRFLWFYLYRSLRNNMWWTYIYMRGWCTGTLKEVEEARDRLKDYGTKISSN